MKENSLATVDTAAGALVEAPARCGRRLPEGVATSSASGPEVALLLTQDYSVALHGSQLSSIWRNSRGRRWNGRLAVREAGASVKGIWDMVHSVL